MEHNFLTSIVHVCTSHELTDLVTDLKEWISDASYVDTYDIPLVIGVVHLSLAAHSQLLNEASRLLERVYDVGGTFDECLDILKYGVVVLDCVKYNLDYKKARADFHIDELTSKYF